MTGKHPCSPEQRPGRRRYVLVAVAWLAAVVVSLVYLFWPAPAPKVPDGWTLWPAPGPTRAIALTTDGTYAGSIFGLFRLTDGGASTPVDLPGPNAHPQISSVLAAPDGSLWVGHERGLAVRTTTGWKTLGVDDGLPSACILSLAAARDGSVWVGTSSGVAAYPSCGPWNRSTVRVLTARDGLLNDLVYVILEDREGGMWFGNQVGVRGGLSRWKDGVWSRWTTSEGLPHSNVACLLNDANGRVWAGCGYKDTGGAAIFAGRGGNWRLEETILPDQLAGAKVRSLCRDRSGRFWIGHEFDGLTIRQGDVTLRKIGEADGLPGKEVMAIAEASDGSMWLGMSCGVVRIDPGAIPLLLAPARAGGGRP